MQKLELKGLISNLYYKPLSVHIKQERKEKKSWKHVDGSFGERAIWAFNLSSVRSANRQLKGSATVGRLNRGGTGRRSSKLLLWSAA